MAEEEEEVYENYAWGVFKAANNPPPAAKRGEETVYDSAGHRRFQHLACCLGILCVILLGGIIGLCVYITNLTRDNKNLADQFGNLKQAYNVSESNNTNLSAGVQELKTRIQELETKTNNLNQKIQDMTTNWNELSISQAQWSIDSYCLGNIDDKCQPCQFGWVEFQSSCYESNDPYWKTWEEAREDCKGENSNLAFAHDSEEKEAINRLGVYGFWIGLRVEDGEWKWVDGSDLIENFWIDPPDPADGHCAVSAQGGGTWSSLNCNETRPWICQKKALMLSV